MGFFGGNDYTPEVSTGNVRTTYNPVNSALPYGNQKNPLGALLYDVGPGTGAVGTSPFAGPGYSPGYPAGAPILYKYVLYKSTTNPALIARPGVVYWTDNTFTTVSGAIGDGVTGTAQDIAGVMMINTTDLSSITATILNNSGNGSYIWICVGGLCKGVNAPASTAVGDYLVGSGSFVLARVPAGTASTFRPLATALTAVASNASDMLVQLQDIC